MTRISIAVVGTGLIGLRHAELNARYAHLAALVDPARDALEEQCKHFLRVCAGEPPLVDGTQELQSLRTIEAINAAAASETRVSVKR